ncbi:MAG TPA: hypothetical protein VKX17_15450 [Planctomycetota bacterium]|nr:hypothetical protein [Planctomycetota bacterium]
MTPERYRTLIAFADGQLSPDEARRVEQSITVDERIFVESECEMVSALRRELDGDAIADEAWQGIVGKLKLQRARRRRPWWIALGASAAAAILVATAYFFFFKHDELADKAEFIVRRAHETLADYRAHIEARPDLDEIRRFVAKYNLNVGFAKLEKVLAENPGGTPFSFLGARMLEYEGMQCVSLMFSCGGQAAQIVLMPPAEKRGEQFKQAAARTEAFVSYRNLSGATALYICEHECCRPLLAYLD